MAGVQKGAPDLFEFVGAKEEWTDKDVIHRIQLTEYAEENLAAELEHLTKQSPMHAPMFNKPNNWGVRNVGPYNTLSLNVLTPIVKNMSPAQETAVNNAMLDGSLNRAMSALNTLQRVPYTLSETVVEMVKWAEKQIVDSNGELKVEGFPSISKVTAVDEKPKAERDKMSPDERKEYFADLTSRKKHNREVKANKLALRRRLQEAKYLLDQQKQADRFYLPMNWDFRGRVYHLAEFGFQNTDYLRAMFVFANKGKVTKKNEHHLLRHLANLFGGGVDKEDHAAREAWARKNMDKILAVGADPKAPDSFDFWRSCDEPFQFMNACVEMYNYHQHGEGYETGLPIAKDATQSGIQFYAVLGRNSDDGRKVNVAPQNVPGDLYTNVRDATEELLHEDIERLEALKEASGNGELNPSDADDLASAYAWRDYGLTRSLMKSPTMTWAYSSDLYGFAKVIRDKIMKELTRDVRQNRLEEHPFEDEGFNASWYMAKLIKKAIVKTVKSAADGMKYLRDMASICTDNKMQFAYTTPLNFPMMQYCRNEKENAARIEMSKWDGPKGRLKAGKVQITQYLDSINRDQAMNGASPNFIHSLDATLLMEAVLLCKSRGITDIMPVHDSFSTTIDNVDMMLDAIKTSFVGLFEDYCPYDDLMQQTVQRIADRTKLPDHGDPDINQLMDSEYAFS